MKPAIDDSRWASLETRVAQVLGLRADETARLRLAEGAAQRMRALGLPHVEDYLSHLDGTRGGGEMHALAQTLTIGESYFLRGADHFAAFAERIVPERLAANRQRPRLRVLSAGCSSGEEIYSLAMILADQFPHLVAEDVELIGIDITDAALEKARRGVYTAWSLRDVPAAVVQRHFRVDHGRYELSADIRRRIRFERVNLLDPQAAFPAGPFDAIFCRNVLIYFTPEAMRQVIARFHALLAPDAYLFLGHSESLRGLSQDFATCQSHQGFYYQRLAAPLTADSLLDAEARRHYGWESALPTLPTVDAPAPPSDDGDWAGAIERSTGRVAQLVDARRAIRPLEVSTPMPAPQGSRYDQALACFRDERYAQACSLTADAPDSASMLLHAAALLQGGSAAQAQSLAARLRTREPMNADAACLLALCQESLGKLEAARELLHTTIYLDSDFAAPQLALARVARRLGDASAERRALQRAQTLVAHESPTRLLLFGGGFSAAALNEMARGQLAGLGARR